MTSLLDLIAMLLRASQAIPPVSAPSPITARHGDSPADRVGLREPVGVAQRRGGVGVLDDVVLGLGLVGSR